MAQRRPFCVGGTVKEPKKLPRLLWGEERVKVLLLTCCYQEELERRINDQAISLPDLGSAE